MVLIGMAFFDFLRKKETVVNESNSIKAQKYHMQSKNYAAHQQWQEALTQINEALKIASDDLNLWMDTGLILGNLGRFDESAFCFKHIMSMDVFNTFALRNAALAYKGKGELLAARVLDELADGTENDRMRAQYDPLLKLRIEEKRLHYGNYANNNSIQPPDFLKVNKAGLEIYSPPNLYDPNHLKDLPSDVVEQNKRNWEREEKSRLEAERRKKEEKAAKQELIKKEGDISKD